jgi:hypothetical protein
MFVYNLLLMIDVLLCLYNYLECLVVNTSWVDNDDSD